MTALRGRRRCRRERGSVAVLACGLVVVLALLAVAVIRLGGTTVVAGRAEAAADAAALAAADEIAHGDTVAACAAASFVAEVNHAQLVVCHREPAAVEVVVELHAPPGELTVPVRARARAEVDLSRWRAGATG